jgi:hypothetical protein
MGLKEAGIIGDIVDHVDKTNTNLTIEYGKRIVQEGTIISPKDSHKAPIIHLNNSDPSALYSFLMTDPDAPSPQNPIKREWLHYIVINVPGGDKAASNRGQEITSYRYVASSHQPRNALKLLLTFAGLQSRFLTLGNWSSVITIILRWQCSQQR